MSNAIIKQGDHSLVADNIWVFKPGGVTFVLGLLLGGAAAVMLHKLGGRGSVPKPKTPSGWPVSFAHRGGAKVVPENTVEGFQAGLEMGGGVVELDVHTSADGEVVVIHDDVVDRTTDGTGPVAEQTFAELRELDAGYRFSTDGGSTFPWRGKGVQIPTLAAIYERFPDRPVNIELKGQRPGLEAAVFEVIEAAGAQDRTLVAADRRGPIQRFREASGGTVATAASVGEALFFFVLSLLRLADLYDPPFQALQPPDKYKGVIPVTTRRLVRAAHRRGLRVDVWTVDEEADMRRLLSYGVDGIMTDRPDVLSRVVAS